MNISNSLTTKKKCPALLGMVTHTYIPSIWKIEARKTIESKISLGYIITTSLKKKKKFWVKT